MNFLTEDFDSLTALPLGIWQPDNECSFDNLSLHNTIHYDPVCVENQSGPASPNISKTYTELHVFPKQEADSTSFLPLTSPFTDITNGGHCEQDGSTLLQEENYNKDIISVTNPMHFGDVASKNLTIESHGEVVNPVGHIHPLQTIGDETQARNTKQRHVVRLTRNRAVRRGIDLVTKETSVPFNDIGAREQTSDDSNNLKETPHLVKGRAKTSIKAAVKSSTKVKNRNKQNKRRKLRDLEKDANSSDIYSDTSLGKKGKSFGKAKFKAEKWNMVFQRKAFLIRYSDVDFFDSNQIWCVVNHKVIRKYIFDRCLPEGKRVYKKTNRLAGWLCNESQHYYPVEVIEVGKDYDEVTVVYPEIDALRMARNACKIEENNDDRIAFATYDNSNGSNEIMETKVEVIEEPEAYSQKPVSIAPSDTTDPWGTTLLEEEEEEDEDEVDED